MYNKLTRLVSQLLVGFSLLASPVVFAQAGSGGGGGKADLDLPKLDQGVFTNTKINDAKEGVVSVAKVFLIIGTIICFGAGAVFIKQGQVVPGLLAVAAALIMGSSWIIASNLLNP